MTHLNNMQVVPLDNPFYPLAIIEYEDHHGLRLHLLLKVEQFGLAAGLGMRHDAGILMREQLCGLAIQRLARDGGCIREPWTHKLARS